MPLVSLALIGSWVHLSYNTNVLGDEELCGGLVSARAAETAFSRTGRVSDDGRPGPRANEASFDCWLDNTSALPGSADLEMHLYTTRDRGDEAFTGGPSPSPPREPETRSTTVPPCGCGSTVKTSARRSTRPPGRPSAAGEDSAVPRP
ncbi:hypothetical protein J116_007615 [Streptomyces thermolilacinus SPC6]|uniref:Uncharacterized protein n=1 Tax=Streptomyces thermolilacinus SPC6 TaxID=1306406 RepID=A0A1D3DPV0_9ACTN|nr:hypothetical protein J116_007615 [Streptomyces thermolilacinus SPC6]